MKCQYRVGFEKSRPTGVLRALKFPTRLTTFQKKSSPHTVGIVCPPKRSICSVYNGHFPPLVGIPSRVSPELHLHEQT